MFRKQGGGGGGKGKAITEVEVLSKDTEDTACRKDMEVDSQDLLGASVNDQIYSLMTDPAVQGQNALTCVDLDPSDEHPTGCA